VSAAGRLDSKKNRAQENKGDADEGEKNHQVLVIMHEGTAMLAVRDVVCIHEVDLVRRVSVGRRSFGFKKIGRCGRGAGGDPALRMDNRAPAKIIAAAWKP